MSLPPISDLCRKHGFRFVKDSRKFKTNCTKCKRENINLIELDDDDGGIRWCCDCGFSGADRLRPPRAKSDGNGAARTDDELKRAFEEAKREFPEDDETESEKTEPERDAEPSSGDGLDFADFIDLTRQPTKLRVLSLALNLASARGLIEQAVLEQASKKKLVELCLDFAFCSPLDDAEIDALRELVAEKSGVGPQVLSDLFNAQAKWRKRTPALKPKPTLDFGGKYMDSKITLASNLANALLALEKEPELVNAFGYDEMLRTEVLLRPLFGSDPNLKPRPVTDADVARVQEHLHWLGMKRLGKDTTHDAINTHARAHAFHPVRDYLNGLRWDGKGRVGTWLSTYLGAKQSDYTEQVGTMFLIGMVARIFEPGCKFDYMLILEGGQALMKSSACAILAGRKYFSDQLPDIISKEASQHLRGKWLIEVAELNAYSRAAIDHFKAYLVRQIERYRPPWGHKEVHEPRQCAFIGTTNKSRYLRDETGNRRFWPVATGDIDLDAFGRNRDQLLAEAVSLYRSGVRWWPERDFELQIIAPEQETRFEVDAWEPLIRDFLEEVNRTTVLGIATGALGYEIEPPESQMGEPPPARKTPINRFGPAEQRRVTTILTHLGWEPKRSNRERWWERGPNAEMV